MSFIVYVYDDVNKITHGIYSCICICASHLLQDYSKRNVVW